MASNLPPQQLFRKSVLKKSVYIDRIDGMASSQLLAAIRLE